MGEFLTTTDQLRQERMLELHGILPPRAPEMTFEERAEQRRRAIRQTEMGPWVTTQVHDYAKDTAFGKEPRKIPAAFLKHPVRAEQYQQAHTYWSGLKKKFPKAFAEAGRLVEAGDKARPADFLPSLDKMSDEEASAYHDFVAALTAPEERFGIEKTLAAVKRAVLSVDENLAEFLREWIERPLGFTEKKGIGRYVEAQQIRRRADPIEPEIKEGAFGLISRGWYGALASAPPMIVGGLGGAALGIPYWITYLAPQRAREFRDRGMSEGAAKWAGLLTAIPEAALEFMGRVPGGKVLSKGLKQGMKRATWEGVKEWAEEPSQETMSRAVYAGAQWYSGTGEDPEFAKELTAVLDTAKESVFPVLFLMGGGGAVQAAPGVAAQAFGPPPAFEPPPLPIPEARRAGQFEVPEGAIPVPRVSELLTPEGAARFVAAKPEEARAIAETEKPSRKLVKETTGVERMSAAERTEFSQLVRTASEQEVPRAEGIGEEVEEARRREELVAEPEGRLRVRGLAEDRVEAEPGEEVAAEKPPPAEGRRLAGRLHRSRQKVGLAIKAIKGVSDVGAAEEPPGGWEAMRGGDVGGQAVEIAFADEGVYEQKLFEWFEARNVPKKLRDTMWTRRESVTEDEKALAARKPLPGKAAARRRLTAAKRKYDDALDSFAEAYRLGTATMEHELALDRATAQVEDLQAEQPEPGIPPVSPQFAEVSPSKPLVEKKDVLTAFPTAKVTQTPSDARWPVWTVELPSGQFLTIETLETIPIDWGLAEETLGRKVKASERAKIAAAGAFILDAGPGARMTGLGVMQLANNLATDETVRHEALHLAKQAGFFKGREWEALVEKHSEPERTLAQQEEDVANARQAWRGKPGLLAGIGAWLRKLLDRLHLKRISGEAVNVLMDQAAFWARKPAAAQPAAGAYQLTFGRPELANPAESPEVRKLVAEVDEGRKIGGEPIARPWSEAQKDADARLDADYAGEKSKLLQFAARGQAFGGEETLIAKGVLNREGAAAVASGDLDALASVIALTQGYRRRLTTVARELAAARDPIETPAERNARALVEAITQPTRKTQHKIEEAEKSGDPEAVKRAYVDAAREARELRAKLAAQGLDLERLEEIAADPDQASIALRQTQAARADIWDVLYEYWANAILSAPTTQAANIIGNTAHTAWAFTAERFTEALVNTFIRDPKGAQWGEFKYLLGGILPGLSRGARNAIRSWRTETPQLGPQFGREGRTKFEQPRIAIAGRKGRVIRAFGYRSLLAADEFAKGLIAEMEVGARAYRIAKAEGLSGMDLQRRIAEMSNDIESEAWDQAIHEAVHLTFQEQGGGVTKAILAARREFRPLAYLVPFVTTPANIFKLGITKSPLGAVGLPFRIYKGVKTGSWEGMTQATAQQILAWGLVLALMGNDEDDPWITGALVEEDYRKQQLARRTFQPQSVRIAGKWWSYGRLEPFATAIGLTVDWLNAIRSGQPQRILEAPFRSLVAQVQTKTFMRGIADFLAAIRGQEPNKVARWGSHFATSWMPNIVRSGLRARKETFPHRGVWGKGSDWYKMLGWRTLQKTEIPSVFTEEYPSRDIWGREAKRGPGFGPYTDWLWRMMLPIYVKEEDVFLGDRMIVNWNNRHPEEAKYPMLPQKYFTLKGKKTYMTEAQYDRFLQLAGSVAGRAVEHRFTPENARDPTERQIEQLTKIISAARRKVKAGLQREWRGGPRFEPDIDYLATHLGVRVR